jgi:hypothetical protein
MIVALILFGLHMAQNMVNVLYWSTYGAITLVLMGVARNKTPGLHIMVNIPVKIVAHTFWVTSDTRLQGKFYTKIHKGP